MIIKNIQVEKCIWRLEPQAPLSIHFIVHQNLGGGDQLIFADIDAQGHRNHENQKKIVVIVDKGIGKTTKPAGCRSRHLYIRKYGEIMKNALFSHFSQFLALIIIVRQKLNYPNFLAIFQWFRKWYWNFAHIWFFMGFWHHNDVMI